VIATGSRPRLLPGFEALGDRGITNEDVFEWEDLPGSVAIFGTGVIGMELGASTRPPWVRTAIFGRSGNVGAFSDPDIQETANNLYHGELEVFPGADVHSMKREKNKVRIRFTTMYGIELGRAIRLCAFGHWTHSKCGPPGTKKYRCADEYQGNASF
jgi:dihydrolipoamide dehydrogenase